MVDLLLGSIKTDSLVYKTKLLNLHSCLKQRTRFTEVSVFAALVFSGSETVLEFSLWFAELP
jgi:hypothetical protein